MAKQRIVNTRFWLDDYIANLDPVEKLLFLYLITNPSTEISGVYELPINVMAVQTGIDKDMVHKILNRFQRDKKIIHKKGWVVIINFVKYQSKNPSVEQGIERALSELPPEIRAIYENIQAGYSLSQTGTPKPKPKPKPKPTVMSDKSDQFDRFWSIYPKKEKKKESLKVWKQKKLDGKINEIVDFVGKAKETRRWKAGYIKQPPAFLRGECWEDDLTSYGELKKINVMREK